MTTALAALTSLPALAVYLVVAALVFAEAAVFLGLVLPAETALLTAGGIAAVGHASLPVLIGVAIVAAVAGDTCGYLVGRRLGPAARTSRAGVWIGADRWDKASEVMDRRGAVAVLTGRWVGVLRALVPAVAGMTGMPYRRYMAWNVVGGVLWVVVVTSAGYLAGAALGASTLAVLSLCALSIAVLVVTTHLIIRTVRTHLGRRHPQLTGAVTPAVIAAELLAVFTVAAVDVQRGGILTRADTPVLGWVLHHRTGWVTTTAQLVTTLGSPVGTAVVAAVAAAVLWRIHRPSAVLLLGGVGVAGAAIWVAKRVTGIARPPAAAQLVAETDASFPSGHVTGTLALYGLLAVVVATRSPRRAARVLAVAVAVLAVVVTAATRLYLGVHWVSDIGGALLLGSVVVALGLAASRVHAVRTRPTAAADPSGARPDVPAPPADHLIPVA